MKTRKILTLLLLSVVFSFSMVAQEQIPANSKNLNKNQKKTLAYAKRLLKRLDGKIALPLEINIFIGDTVTNEQYHAVPVWDKAYFMDVDGFTATLVLPINAKTPNGEINSFLNLYNDEDTQYLRFVETVTKTAISNEKIKCYTISNVRGILLQNIISQNGAIVEVQNSIVGYSGVIDGKSNKSNYDKKSMDHVLHKTAGAVKWSMFKTPNHILNWHKASSGQFFTSKSDVVRDGPQPRSK